MSIHGFILFYVFVNKNDDIFLIHIVYYIFYSLDTEVYQILF